MRHKAWSDIDEVLYSFFKVIHHFSRSHGTKNRWFWPELSVSGQYLQFEFTKGFEMLHKTWCNVKEVPYTFSSSSIKFQGHTGWKIDDLNPILVRLLGPSQLSNPSDLPCYNKNSATFIFVFSQLIGTEWRIYAPVHKAITSSDTGFSLVTFFIFFGTNVGLLLIWHLGMNF